MSLSSGLIAIKGQHATKLAEIFNCFNLVDTNNDKILSNWDNAIEVIDHEFMNPDESSQRRVVWFDNGWTLIEDFSMILCTDNKSLLKISQHLSTPVFSLATQGTGGCYGFWYFDRHKLRGFFYECGEVTDNFGEPLPQEANFNINENAAYDDIHGVAKQFGIDLANAENVKTFIVKQLDNNEERDNEIRDVTKNYYQVDDTTKSKPWWKFW